MKKRPNNGFTLLEMMGAMGIFSLMMVLVFTILQGGVDQASLADTKMNLQESTRESLYRISQKIRQTAPNRICVGADASQCTNPGSTVRFCMPNPANPVNSNRCTGNCTNEGCEYTSVSDCVSNCNQAWDTTWKKICNINCNSACAGYCNADYQVNWKDSVRIQFGVNNGQLMRTDMTTGQATATQTVEVNDIQNVTFTPHGNPINAIGLSVTAQPTLNRTSLLKGRVLSVTSSSEAKLRNP